MILEAVENISLFDRYKETGDLNLRNEIVIKYFHIVKIIAHSTRNMYQKLADTDDIINEGTIALISAIDTFDNDKNVKFETYANIRIRGAIIDYIRKLDFAPRNIRKFSKDLNNAYTDLYAKLDRAPTTAEISEYMDIPIDKLRKYMADSSSAMTVSFEELLTGGTFDIGEEQQDGLWSAEKDIHIKERRQMLIDAISNLRENEKQVISLYYYEKLKFSEIAKVLEVSESRVCQIHSKAMLSLRHSMKAYITN